MSHKNGETAQGNQTAKPAEIHGAMQSLHAGEKGNDDDKNRGWGSFRDAQTKVYEGVQYVEDEIEKFLPSALSAKLDEWNITGAGKEYLAIGAIAIGLYGVWKLS